jgi:hypothetical protein
MTVLHFPHTRQNCFDHVDVREEVGFELLLHETDGTGGLSELFDSADHRYTSGQRSNETD